jgi:hypothetical protein
MRTMHDLVGDILALKKTDLDTLAEALAIFDNDRAEQLKFLLDSHTREEELRRAA